MSLEYGSNPWNIGFVQMFNKSHDSHVFKQKSDFTSGFTRKDNCMLVDDEVYVPLIDGSSVNQYQVDEILDTDFWVKRSDVVKKTLGWDKKWFLGWRKLCSTSNSHLLIASIVPFYGISNSFNIICSDKSPKSILCLLSCMNSLIVNYCAQSKVVGLNFSGFILKQLPILPPQAYAQKCPWSIKETLEDWISSRVFKLLYSNSHLKPFATDMEFYGPPIILTDEERLFLRAEIDAAMFILYGIVNKDDLEFILNTFSTLRKKEESKFGIFKTKQLIFQIYDKLVESSFALNQKQSSISSASSISLVMR